MKNKKPYWLRVLLVIDNAANVIFLNGSEDHTISGHVGYRAMKSGKKRWLLAEKLINKLFYFQPDHCRNAIEWDEVEK